MHRLTLRFENMPERHAELAWRFGEPDECVTTSEDPPSLGGSRWKLNSPLPPDAPPTAHLTWASELLGPHEGFVGELVSLGGEVTLSLTCQGGAAGGFQLNARLLLPMAHAGIQLELYKES